MQSSYEALQQRRERIDFALGDGACQPFTRCIRALLDDFTDLPDFATAEDGSIISIPWRFLQERALSIAEKELGL